MDHHFKLYSAILLYSILMIKYSNGAPTKQPNITVNTSLAPTLEKEGGIHVFVVMFDHVSTPFLVCCWILFASIAKVVFHHFENLSAAIPESCIFEEVLTVKDLRLFLSLLILLGVPVGFILQSANFTTHTFLTSNLFFQYLLPPIIFDAGYFINTTTFFNNIGTILLYAIVGTIFNTFCIGACMYGVASHVGVSISLLQSFLFGSVISAVDPVAVLTVFEEVQVNEVLYMLVFGESVLNDAASVVLYRTFESLPKNVDEEQVGLAIAFFLVVSIFGTIIGILFGLIASFLTRFTDHVRVIEPIFVFIMAYMAYLTAEIFHFSGIMSILFCGVVMKPYVESNVSRKSHVTIKYFLKLLSSSCEAVIFMFLGIALVQYSHVFNLKLVVLVIVFITVFRAIGTVSLTYLANKLGRLAKISKMEQFIMCYGGLRGAVAFCLAIIIKVGDEKLKDTLVTTTLAVIVFTCFVQGGTIKMFVEKLNIQRADKRDLTMAEHINERMMNHVVTGVEGILGIHGYNYWKSLMEEFNRKILRPLLTRNPEEFLDDYLISEKRRRDYKEGMERSDMSVSGSMSGSVSGSMTESASGSDLASVMSEVDYINRRMSNESVMGDAEYMKHKLSVPSLIDDDANVPAYENHAYSASTPPQSNKMTETRTRRRRVQEYVNSVSELEIKSEPIVDPKEYFLQFYPESKRIRSRARYSDAAVGLQSRMWESMRRKRRRSTHGHRIPEHVRKASRRSSRRYSEIVQPQQGYEERQRKISITPHTPRKHSHTNRTRKRSSVRSYCRQQEMVPTTIEEDEEIEENGESSTEKLDDSEIAIESAFYQNEAYLDDNGDNVFLEKMNNEFEEENNDFKDDEDSVGSKISIDDDEDDDDDDVWVNHDFEESISSLNLKDYVDEDRINIDGINVFENFYFEDEYLPRLKGRSMSEWNLGETIVRVRRKLSNPEKPDQREIEFNSSQSNLSAPDKYLDIDNDISDKDTELHDYLVSLNSSSASESCSRSHSGSLSFTGSGSESNTISRSNSQTKPEYRQENRSNSRSASRKESRTRVSQESSSNSSSDFRRISRSEFDDNFRIERGRSRSLSQVSSLRKEGRGIALSAIEMSTPWRRDDNEIPLTMQLPYVLPHDVA